MRVFIRILVFLATVQMAAAQGDAGEGELDVTVQVSPKVQGLTFNSTAHRHEATYTVSATVAQNPQPGYVRTFTWSGQGLEFDDIHASSTTARVTGPTVYYPSRAVHDAKQGSTLFYDGDDTKYCYAIGGPVLITLVPQGQATFHHDHNDSTLSFYLTYYGYTHSQARPALSQPSQDAIAEVWPQPQGTTVTSSIYSSTLQTNPNALQISLQAEDGFSDQPIRAHFAFTEPTPPGGGGTGSCDGNPLGLIVKRRKYILENEVVGESLLHPDSRHRLPRCVPKQILLFLCGPVSASTRVCGYSLSFFVDKLVGLMS